MKLVTWTGIFILTTGLCIYLTIFPAEANEVCKVTDPTGTPLNVRDQPNGRIINTIKNGREVRILAMFYDTKNRPWVEVSGYYKGQYKLWGWVFREFITCYNR